MARASPVAFFERSTNRKLSPVEMVKNGTPRLRPEARPPYCASTYVSIEATCPNSCTFKAEGCYVREGFTGQLAEQLDEAARRPPRAIVGDHARSKAKLRGRHRLRERPAGAASSAADAVAYLESEAIAESYGGRLAPIPQIGACGGPDLRLHVGGECPNERAARWLAEAVRIYQLRGGGSAWTFTHNWRVIPREAWGPISVLASVESLEEAREARALGYAPAITTSFLPSRKAFKRGALRIVPCPGETGKLGDTTCVECRLCLDRDLHELGIAIAFVAHGAKESKLKLRLPMLAPEEIFES